MTAARHPIPSAAPLCSPASRGLTLVFCACWAHLKHTRILRVSSLLVVQLPLLSDSLLCAPKTSDCKHSLLRIEPRSKQMHVHICPLSSTSAGCIESQLEKTPQPQDSDARHSWALARSGGTRNSSIQLAKPVAEVFPSSNTYHPPPSVLPLSTLRNRPYDEHDLASPKSRL